MTELGRIEFMEDARIDKITLYNIGQNSLMIKLGWLWGFTFVWCFLRPPQVIVGT